MSRFRLSSHNLEIETGRYNNIARENRICKFCNQNAIETEYHFLLCCSAYDQLRNKLCIRSSWPNIINLRHLCPVKIIEQ